MSLNKTTLLGAVAALALTAGSASALTTIVEGPVLTRDMTVASASGMTTIGAPAGFFFDTTDFSFAWDLGTDARVAGFIRFTVDTTFDLVLQSYSGAAGTSAEVTGYIFSERGQPMLTDDNRGLCSFNYPICNFLGNGTGSSVSTYSEGSTLFAGLAAGEYYLGVEEVNAPTTGSATFAVVEAQAPSPIPLPAGGWLLVTALGGLAAMRARRKSDDE
jgi:hypothetical protein